LRLQRGLNAARFQSQTQSQDGGVNFGPWLGQAPLALALQQHLAGAGIHEHADRLALVRFLRS
jgi:hypothetical protein